MVQRGLAFIVPDIRVGAGIQQHCNHLVSLLACCPHKRSSASLVTCVRVGAGIEESLDHIGIGVIFGRVVQWGLAQMAPGIRIGAGGKQHERHFGNIVFRRLMQRGYAVVFMRFRIGAGLQECPGYRRVFIARGEMEWSTAGPVAFVRVGSSSKENGDNGGVGIETGRTMDGSFAVLVPGIDIRSCVDQRLQCRGICQVRRRRSEGSSAPIGSLIGIVAGGKAFTHQSGVRALKKPPGVPVCAVERRARRGAGQRQEQKDKCARSMHWSHS